MMNGLTILQKRQQNRFLQIQCVRNVESLDDRFRPIIRFFVCLKADLEMWRCSSNKMQHKTTLHRSGRNADLFGNWTMQQLGM